MHYANSWNIKTTKENTSELTPSTSFWWVQCISLALKPVSTHGSASLKFAHWEPSTVPVSVASPITWFAGKTLARDFLCRLVFLLPLDVDMMKNDEWMLWIEKWWTNSFLQKGNASKTHLLICLAFRSPWSRYLRHSPPPRSWLKSQVLWLQEIRKLTKKADWNNDWNSEVVPCVGECCHLRLPGSQRQGSRCRNSWFIDAKILFSRLSWLGDIQFEFEAYVQVSSTASTSQTGKRQVLGSNCPHKLG